MWFKVDAEGYDPSTKKWAADKLISGWLDWVVYHGKIIDYLIDDSSWTSTIPAGLKAGEYVSILTPHNSIHPEPRSHFDFLAYAKRDVSLKRSKIVYFLNVREKKI
jgi:hypothetical protein